MSIQIQCGCGKRLKVKDEYAGKRTRCPSCDTAVIIPKLSKAAISAAAPSAPRTSPKPAPAEDMPSLDDLYDLAEQAATAPQVEAPAPPPPSPARPAPSPARRTQSTAPIATAPAIGYLGVSASRARSNQSSGGVLHLSPGMKILIGAVIVIPTVIFLGKIGPVKAVEEWGKAQKAGKDDVSSVVLRAISDRQAALFGPPELNEAVPRVTNFVWQDPPIFMIRMPESVEFFGTCSSGRYEGAYFTRTGEVKATVEGFDGTITGRVKGNTVEAEIDGTSTKDFDALRKNFGGGFLDAFTDETEQSEIKTEPYADAPAVSE